MALRKLKMTVLELIRKTICHHAISVRCPVCGKDMTDWAVDDGQLINMSIRFGELGDEQGVWRGSLVIPCCMAHEKQEAVDVIVRRIVEAKAAVQRDYAEKETEEQAEVSLPEA